MSLSLDRQLSAFISQSLDSTLVQASLAFVVAFVSYQMVFGKPRWSPKDKVSRELTRSSPAGMGMQNGILEGGLTLRSSWLE